METVDLNPHVERVHRTRDHKISRKNQTKTITKITLVILEHNHLITIEMEIVHNNHFHAAAFQNYEPTLILFQTKNRQTTQRLTLNKRNCKMFQKNNF